MSAVWAADPPIAKAKTGRAPRPRLRVVRPAPARIARVPFLGVLIILFGAGMAGLLMLNTTLQDQTFQVTALNRQATELDYTEAELQGQLAQLNAPQEIARRASAAGFRPDPHAAQLALPSGKVTGEPTKVTGNETPLLVVKTPAELAKERAAAAAKKAAALAKEQAAAAKAAADARARQLQTEQAAQAAQAAQQLQQKKAGR